MRTILVLLVLSLTIVAIPSTAEAHTDACLSDATVAKCMADCVYNHLKTALPHNCYIIVT